MWASEKSYESVLLRPKTVKVHGMDFLIKKIDTTSFLDGSKVLLQVFDTYKVGKTINQDDININKIKEHYRDVFMSSIKKPVLSRKPNIDGTLFVDHLFTDWGFATELYLNIIEHTYGKKKLKRSI